MSNAKWYIIEISESGAERVAGNLRSDGKNNFTLGRSSKSDVTIGREDVGVSRKQLLVDSSGKKVFVQNIGKDAVLLSAPNKSLVAGQRVEIKEGLSVRVSHTTISFQSEIAPENHVLELSIDGKTVKTVDLGDKEIKIGTSPDNDMPISADGVSRVHVTIKREKSGVFLIEDQESKNGVFVKDQTTTKSVRISSTELKSGETFSFGTVVGKIVPAVAPKKVSRKKIVLLGVAGCLVVAWLCKPGTPPTTTPVDSYDSKIKAAWMVGELVEKRDYLQPLREHSEEGSNRRKTLERLIELVECNLSISSEVKKIEAMHADAAKYITSAPWKLSTYTDMANVDDLNRQLSQYKKGVKGINELAEQGVLSADEIRGGISTELMDRAFRTLTKATKSNECRERIRKVLIDWEANQFPNPLEGMSELKQSLLMLSPEHAVGILGELDVVRTVIVQYDRAIVDTLKTVEEITSGLDVVGSAGVPNLDQVGELNDDLSVLLNIKGRQNIYSMIKASALDLAAADSASARWATSAAMIKNLDSISELRDVKALITGLEKYRSRQREKVLNDGLAVASELSSICADAEEILEDTSALRLAAKMPGAEYLNLVEDILSASDYASLHEATNNSDRKLREYCEHLYVEANYNLDDENMVREIAQKIMKILDLIRSKEIALSGGAGNSIWIDKMDAWARRFIKASQRQGR